MSKKVYKTQILSKYILPIGWNAGGSWLKKIIWLFFGKNILASFIPGTSWRKFILRLFGAKIGKGGRIKPFIQITYPWNLIIGDYCWIGEKVWIDNLGKVILGDNVCISQNAYLCTGNHNYNSPNFELKVGNIIIYSEAWIAANTTIGPGTVIGERAIIALGSVVSGEVPPGEILKGNPAKTIRKRK